MLLVSGYKNNLKLTGVLTRFVQKWKYNRLQQIHITEPVFPTLKTRLDWLKLAEHRAATFWCCFLFSSGSYRSLLALCHHCPRHPHCPTRTFWGSCPGQRTRRSEPWWRRWCRRPTAGLRTAQTPSTETTKSLSVFLTDININIHIYIHRYRCLHT